MRAGNSACPRFRAQSACIRLVAYGRCERCGHRLRLRLLPIPPRCELASINVSGRQSMADLNALKTQPEPSAAQRVNGHGTALPAVARGCPPHTSPLLRQFTRQVHCGRDVRL